MTIMDLRREVAALSNRIKKRTNASAFECFRNMVTCYQKSHAAIIFSEATGKNRTRGRYRGGCENTTDVPG